jgi:hypothetical protein
VETVKMFKQNGKSPEGVCLVTEFESALKYCDISFSARSSEYLQLVCYESLPEDILRMEYLNVLEHFS